MSLDQTVDLDKLFYACLYHFMGHNIISKDYLKKYGGKGEWKDMADTLLRYIKAEDRYNSLKTIEKRVNADAKYLNELATLHKTAGKVIVSQGYYDEEDYPRKFYKYKAKNFTPEQISTVLLPAIFLYVLRSHCSSWAIKQTEANMITDSKEALNDLIQAESLLQNLLFDLQVTEKRRSLLYSSEGLYVEPPTAAGIKTSSLLFVLSCVINIFKGNIYKNINFVENALDSYCKAIRLYEESIRIEDKGDITAYEKWGNFLCPTIGQCYFEVSKLLFDKGRIIDALSYELDSIIHLVAFSYAQGNKNGIDDAVDKTFKDLVAAKENLGRIRYFSRDYVRRDLIMSIFVSQDTIKNMYKYTNGVERADAISPILLNSAPLVSPERLEKLAGIIPKPLKPIVSPTIADIMARIGFVLYTIRETIQLERCPDKFRETGKTANVVDAHNKAILVEIKPYFSGFDGYESELGNYTCAFVYPGQGKKQFFSKRIERVFSNTLKDIAKEEGEDFEKFSNKLLKRSLITAGHLSSIPVRMSHYLLQEGYRERTSKGRSFGRNALNKLVILRRWQSFNPKVPRPRGQDVRGGGYFLFWNGRGIVIDPGYSFIQNFYEEGFSLRDIDAIVVTHSHPDHDNEMNTILTLLAEWNQMQEMEVRSDPKKKDSESEEKHIDLFLNEGAYRKYNSWLYATKIMVKKIYLLQGARWDKKSEESGIPPEKSNANPVIDLKSTYGLRMEVVPAWHDELIDKHSSVGLIFQLYRNEADETPQVKIGFTGDTENYDGIASHYRGVDVLVAHLGDVKFHEFLCYTEDPDSSIGMFVKKWLNIGWLPKSDLLDILRNYLIHQEIFGLEEKYLRDPGVDMISKKDQVKELTDCKADSRKDINITANVVKFYSVPNEDFKYANHLGLKGLFDLHKFLVDELANTQGSQSHTKIMIIGELPEELQSYRHIVACILDEHRSNKPVRCLTGDIGLTVGLPTEYVEYGDLDDKSHPFLAIRCMKCNQNNEYIKGIEDKDNTVRYLPHYHPIEGIQEIPLRASNSRIAWFCLKHHASHPNYAKHEYFIDPDLRSVWK